MIMQINEKTKVGLEIIELLAKNGNIKAKDLISSIEIKGAVISKPYFEDCIAPIVKSGIVISKLGCVGGYKLREGTITFWDLIKSYDNGWDLIGGVWGDFLDELIEVAASNNIVEG
jgi:DNA-binding IscR family transcriptional regulator